MNLTTSLKLTKQESGMAVSKTCLPSKPKTCMLGPFPPPVHGMAWLNYAMREHMGTMNLEVSTIDLSASSLERGWFARSTKWKKVLRGLARYAWLVFQSKAETLYLSLSGGYGQLFELLFVLIARVSKTRIVIHHHSFAYLIRRKVLTSLVFRCAGPRVLHISGCSAMSRKLQELYEVKNVEALSNAALVWLHFPRSGATRPALRTIGFMGNISFEKGIAEFLDVAELLKKSGVPIRIVIAGPFQDPALENFVRERLRSLPAAEYVGARYGSAKYAYFSDIDLLLFPSKYDNETDPVTVYEAMASGVPVIAWDRGCLANVIVPGSGALIGRDEDFVTAAHTHIREWQASDITFSTISNAAIQRFEDMAAEYIPVLNRVVSLVADIPGVA
jgi:glycosyltransferase involved in cell wall biosynthesis